MESGKFFELDLKRNLNEGECIGFVSRRRRKKVGGGNEIEKKNGNWRIWGEEGVVKEWIKSKLCVIEWRREKRWGRK